MSSAWLHRHVYGLNTFAARTYYRVKVAGSEVPRTGPLLLVANHPNSLLDPALVAIAAQRPVRWLARAGLFQQRSIGWLIRGSGAIPVHRRGDLPSSGGTEELRNVNLRMFGAVRAALVAGDAIGVFPEGLSHSAPSLAPLKTGAARIALGAAAEGLGEFPVLPVGLTFRGGKERFRSDALLLVGRPIRWADLADAGESDTEAVRDLTQRIHAGLSRVTVNLESWDDFPIVEGAEAIHHAEYGRSRSSNPVRWLARMRRTATLLQTARTRGEEEQQAELEADVLRHKRVLDSVGLEPRDLHHVPSASVAVRWTLKNLLFFGVAAPLALLGAVVFFFPYRLVGWAEPKYHLPPDKRATYKVLGGATACGGWILALAALLREMAGWQPALAALLVLPLLGIMTLAIRDRWQTAATDLRRILLLKGRQDLRRKLLERQADLALRLRSLGSSADGGKQTVRKPRTPPVTATGTESEAETDPTARTP